MQRGRAWLAAALAVACASGGGSLPDEGRSAGDYEVPPRERAGDLWPAAVERGPGWEVEAAVVSDGRHRRYRVRAGGDVLDVRGDELLAKRVRELRAVAALREMGGTDEFAQGVARALQNPFVARWNLITRPVATLDGAPVGALSALGDGGGERAAVDLLAFGATKRELAYWLRVDPYAGNRPLQRELNRVAWTLAAGEIPFDRVPFARPGAFESDGRSLDESLRETLRLSTPEELRARNRAALAGMGVPKSLADAFLEDLRLSPTDQRVVVTSLEALDTTRDRAALLRVAVDADSADAVRDATRSATLLRRDHESGHRLEHLIVVDGAVGGVSSGGALVVCLPADELFWTASVAALADAIRRELPRAGTTRAELVLSGARSERAERELEARGIAIREQLDAPEARR